MDTRGKEAAALALHRFGFGPSHNSITAIAADPRGALLAELARPGAGFFSGEEPSSAAAARAVSDFRAEEQAKSKLAQRAKKEAEAGMASASDAAASTPTMSTPPKPSGPPLPQQIFENEAAARYEAAVGADIGFVERLVWFWSNHFCISADKDVAMVGAYEREAIRAHVLGRFADMLIAVVRAVQATLGESLWRPPAPNGWPDTEAAWIDGVPHRLDIANEFAGHLPSTDPAALLETGLGPIVSHNTRDTIARAETRTQALALLVMAPEFLRR